MKVYADHAATTRMSEAAKQAMLNAMDTVWGNPSSLYTVGQEAKTALEEAREKMAALLGGAAREYIFTAGGSEADNQALIGAALLGAKKGKKHIISTKFEHHAVLHTLKKLEKEGFEVTLLDVHENGVVTADEVKKAIREDTALVSVMYVNNEIGTVQPIREIGAVCREKGVIFHTDAVQAVGHIPVNVEEDNIDLLSLSAHKFNGPKGVGALYMRRGIRLKPLIEGGAQENGRRAGTENVPGILGMVAALEQAVENMEENNQKILPMRDTLIEGLSAIPYSKLNGDREKRAPGTVNFCFEGIEGESLLLLLDFAGISASSGSACTSGSLDPSHVLLSLGLPHEVAHGSLRLSIDTENTPEQMAYVVEQVNNAVTRLRAMSPVWEQLEKGERRHLFAE
ncbi:MAG: cysteine desulfurase [Clostridia bacterium]|nr:cysteine desulfurase [Clostridia bacterium]